MHEPRGVRQIEIDQFAAVVADRVIVTFRFTIVTAGTVAEIDFEHEAGLFQIAQRVIDCGIADTGQP